MTTRHMPTEGIETIQPKPILCELKSVSIAAGPNLCTRPLFFIGVFD